MKRFSLLLAFSILIFTFGYAQGSGSANGKHQQPQKNAINTEKGVKPTNGKPDFQGILQLKRDYIKENLNLPDAKSSKFWTIFDQYINEEKKIHTAFLSALKGKNITREMLYDEKKLNDEQLSFVMDQKMNYKEKMFLLDKKFYNQAKSVLSSRELAKLYKLEQGFKNRCKQFDHKNCKHPENKAQKPASPEHHQQHHHGQDHPKAH